MTKTTIALLRKNVTEELFLYPYISKEDRIKMWIKKYILCKGGQSIEKYSWPNALLAIALQYDYEATGNEQSGNGVEKYLDALMKKKYNPKGVEQVLNGYCLLKRYEMEDRKEYAEYAHHMFECLKNYPKDKAGSLPYAAHRDSDIYVDGIGMVCPFLSMYGKIFSNREAKDMATLQIENFMKYGMDSKTGLPYHGYNLAENQKKGIIGWGRGVGWLLMGMVAAVETTEREERTENLKILNRLIKKIMAYQQENGCFSWQIEALEGPMDTSASAMILYALKDGIQKGLIEDRYFQSVEYGKNTLISLLKAGHLEQSSAECGGFGIYPQQYGEFPWSIGPLLSLINI